MRNRCILILTPGRTGSSAVAGILDKLGIVMGHPITLDKEMRDFAPSGLYEDVNFWDLNFKAWNGRVKNPYDLVGSYAALFYTRRNTSLWGLKDPQALHTFDVFEPLLGDYRVIFPIRDRDSTICSFLSAFGGGEYLKRINSEGIPEERFVERLIDQRLELIEYLKQEYQFNYLPIPYNDLLENPSGWVASISTFVFDGTGYLPHPDKVVEAIEHIDPSLRKF